MEKCTLVLCGSNPVSAPGLPNLIGCLPIEHLAKYLGVWWNSAPCSKQSIKERINSAQPLESTLIHIECCILPVLMYKSESWILNLSLLSKLVSFQSKLGVCIAKVHFKQYSSSFFEVALPTSLQQTLLHTISNCESVSLSIHVFRTLAASDVRSKLSIS